MKQSQSDQIKPGYLRRAGAARYLSISIRTLCDLQAKRRIAFSKLGKKTCLFKISDLDAFVASLRQDSIGGMA
jgi:excisionase family DNA binding protein